MPRGGSAPPCTLPLPAFVRMLGCFGESCSFCNKVAKRWKDVKTVRGAWPKTKETGCRHWKLVSAAIAWTTQLAKSPCFARVCYIPWLKLGFPSRTVRLHTPPLPVRKHQCALANCGFATIIVTSKLAGLQKQGHIAGKRQCFGSLKNGHCEANHLATTGYQGEAMVRRNRSIRLHLEKWVTADLAHI